LGVSPSIDGLKYSRTTPATDIARRDVVIEGLRNPEAGTRDRASRGMMAGPTLASPDVPAPMADLSMHVETSNFVVQPPLSPSAPSMSGISSSFPPTIGP
jgi:hypothetical protein